MSEAEKRNTAFHEAGHAIVGRLVPEHDPVYKVSIIPRGRALGVTMFLPEEDRYSLSRRHILSQICSLYGGRIAEELTLGPDGVTTGASNDIQRASDIARSMVTKWGLSEELGPLMYDEAQEEVFLGRSAGTQSKSISADTAQKIDKEVRRISDECYARATVILTENRDKLDAMADALMTYETIDAAQIEEIMAGREPGAPSNWSDDSAGGDETGGGDTVASSESDTDAESNPDSKTDSRDPNIGGPAGEH
jgi:cell division protease FtsH